MDAAPFRPLAELIRRTVHGAWRSRGGGFYGLVAALTFLWVQAAATLRAIAHPALPDIGLGWLIGRFLAGIGLNIGLSMIWPLAWLGRFGLVRAALLVGVALVAYRVLRPVIESLTDTPIAIIPETAEAPAMPSPEPQPVAPLPADRSPG